MAKRNVLHIKRHTEGTSNELSFDVLEAASNQLDDKKKQRGGGQAASGAPARASKRAVSRAGVPIPKGTRAPSTPASDSGNKQPSTSFTVNSEVDRRKKKRKSQSFWRNFAIAFVVIGAVAGAAWFAHGYFQEKQEYSALFSSMVDQLVDVDKTLVQLDDMMLDPMEGASSSDRDAARQAAAKALEDLQGVRAQALKLQELTDDERDLAAIDQMIAAVDGRIDMIEFARQAIGYVETSKQQVAAANEAWSVVVDADQVARSAAELANRAYTQEETISARESSQEALAGFSDARARLDQIESSDDSIDLSAQRAYLDKRIEAMQHAVDTGDALLAGDRDAAAQSNDAYNAADQEAARMAADLPNSLQDPIEAVYEDRIAALVGDYEKARQQVSESDAVIREYLGEQGK